MRIAVAGIHHESNTFSPIITGENDFLVYRGQEMPAQLTGSSSIGGIIDTLQKKGHEVLPACFARAVPNGIVDGNFFREFTQDIYARFAAFGHIDAIVLGLHGSMSVQGTDDPEGDLLEALRLRYPGLPITASLDMHATVTEKMLRNCDGFAGYKTAPHVDTYETGIAAANLMLRHLETGLPLRMAAKKLPILIAGEQTETSTEPMASLIALTKKAEAEEGLLSASILLGFPWADNPHNGVTIVAVSLGDPTPAQTWLARAAREFWNARRKFKFLTESLPVYDAISAACASKHWPVFISDSGDNPTAGSTGDSTHFFTILLTHPSIKNFDGKIGYAGFFDPEAVAACRGNIGKKLSLSLGGKIDTVSGLPVNIECEVIAFVESWGRLGTTMAAVRTGTIDVLITSKHIGFGDDIDMWKALNLNPADYPVLCLKLGYLTEIYFPYKPRSILALSKGASNELLSEIPYRRLPRPIYPLDDNFDIPL